MRRKLEIPEEIEEYRHECWRREGTQQVETTFDAERFAVRPRSRSHQPGQPRMGDATNRRDFLQHTMVGGTAIRLDPMGSLRV